MKFSNFGFLKTIGFVKRHAFWVVCVGFFVYMLVFCEYSVYDIMKLRRQEAELRREISMYKDSIGNFEQRIEEVSVDETKLERLARERMHMHRADEDLYLIDK